MWRNEHCVESWHVYAGINETYWEFSKAVMSYTPSLGDPDVYILYMWNMWMCSINCKDTLTVSSSEFFFFFFELDRGIQLTFTFMKNKCLTMLGNLSTELTSVWETLWLGDGWRRLYLSTGCLSFVQPNRALIHSAVHESGSWRRKGQHCLCSAMLNQFGLDNILKLWLQLEDFVWGGEGSDGCILLVMTAVRGLNGIEMDLGHTFWGWAANNSSHCADLHSTLHWKTVLFLQTMDIMEC